MTCRGRTLWSPSRDTRDLAGIFPMALMPGPLPVGYRNPSAIEVLSRQDGSRLASILACGDTDDVSFDRDRSRVYVV